MSIVCSGLSESELLTDWTLGITKQSLGISHYAHDWYGQITEPELVLTSTQ